MRGLRRENKKNITILSDNAHTYFRVSCFWLACDICRDANAKVENNFPQQGLAGDLTDVV